LSHGSSKKQGLAFCDWSLGNTVLVHGGCSGTPTPCGHPEGVLCPLRVLTLLRNGMKKKKERRKEKETDMKFTTVPKGHNSMPTAD
jgi:hypothetical protein